MTEGFAIKLIQEALFYVILISAPMLGISMLVGLVISILQTATSIQEQTLSFVPKIVITLLAMIVFGSWMLKTLMEYTIRLINTFPDLMG
ncbi:EscS/YscS/HrcS family type III secretion system export apparatus protein [Candidatus Desantisbacteria bacterium CG2_30_40_21]|uniref:Flagellar biosynthetic protein FliQ n=5 Tax=unclassified Candidatus Desantisiibacteriota TaxID=3106372 RepID=A0A2M7JER6_9BACT|nr:MAG: EscS/YscS/HrcS family type III secretion system export apparatus protein [Candidatus Desantisbacteria bacterium CG2_30_40_21]PIP42284.1 MAG: flagellar biosynthetic protein FliQ [Candidatus Desantisbacteria bacterium CG23_combo_of_CG06-09_8_20_14_all_40_23]PIX17873.1 MAG: flagellar biosynthetic protein FliQ [Candidatus Desantisbacteria bacterium CG_4_8_14_3_um_filter_40_12]PIY19636.1 MAG: flagellar biosynthetic protein FliQ [Candidatus Desantisbacteria bacterium CG_4_10_14_3_um_filter_40_